ncbi:MAG: glycosyltransferase family 4 protein [Acidobacteriota bacterium]|nr:glycosyltransferase family 4 protein [Acidobacteriota bacterium]
MTVYYSHDIFSAQAYGGVSRYFVELIRHMPESEIQVEILAGLHISRHLDSGPRVKGIRVPEIPRSHKLMHSCNELFQKTVLPKVNGGIVHQTYFFKPPVKRKQKLVITVHDMIHEIFSKDFDDSERMSDLKRQYCAAADQIIAVSHSTKEDLIERFNIDPEKIAVVHHGVTSLGNGSAKYRQTSAPYLLYVGKRGAYKNFKGLAEAYAASDRLRQSFDLVCFGGGAWASEEEELLRNLKLSHKVKVVSGDDGLLAHYYETAHALVYPSLYEGFGIPLIEAMSVGCPVICSNTSSLPEVAGDAAAYFDPRERESMTAIIENVLFSDSKRAELIKKGACRVKQFNWKTAASETVKLYTRCAN